MSMSLGFNTQRQPRKTNLPGSVLISMPRPQARANTTPSTPIIKPLSLPLSKSNNVDDGEFHGVYATVCNTLTDVDTSEEVSSDSARVYVVNPSTEERFLTDFSLIP